MVVAAQHSVSIVEPFDAIAASYDRIFTDSLIGRAQRAQVWKEMDRTFQPRQRLLEINCGTGVDACHMAARGIRVLACDSSQSMIAVAQQRLRASEYENLVEFRQLAIERLAQLRGLEPFDGVLSNFGGLNCISDLRSVARDLASVVKPGGKLILCVFGRFCFWEILWYLLCGDSIKAFRRLRTENDFGRSSTTTRVLIKYHSVRALQRAFSPYFMLRRWRGVGVAVPPSYLEKLAGRFTGPLRVAARLDSLFGPCPGIRALADHALVTLERLDE